MSSMFDKRLTLIAVPLVVAGLVAAGCGSSSSGSSSASTGSGQSQKASDAASAATGDIPDNQAFLTFRDAKAGYALKYPEGWTRRGSGADVTFVDKDNAIQVVVSSGAAPTPKSVAAGLDKLKASEPTLKAQAPKLVTLKHGSAIKVSYAMQGAANSVTGKRPLLLVDRYVYAKAGTVATLDLRTPKGVDNVDAYRLISQSFAWR